MTDEDDAARRCGFAFDAVFSDEALAKKAADYFQAPHIVNIVTLAECLPRGQVGSIVPSMPEEYCSGKGAELLVRADASFGVPDMWSEIECVDGGGDAESEVGTKRIGESDKSPSMRRTP